MPKITVEEKKLFHDIRSFLWKKSGRIALPVVTRIFQFSGNGLLAAGLSSNDNADAVSIFFSYDEMVAIYWGSFIIGVNVDAAIARGQFKEGTPVPTIALSFLGGLTVTALATLMSAPFYYSKLPREIFSLALPQNTTDMAVQMTQTAYSNGYVLGKQLDVFFVSILLAMRFDKTMLIANFIRFVFIALAVFMILESNNNPSSRVAEFGFYGTLSFCISNSISFLSLFLKSKNEIKQPSMRGIICKSKLIWSLSAYLKKVRLIIAIGFNIMLDFAPSLISEFIMVIWLANSVDKQTISAMAGINFMRVITILAGNGVFNFAMREASNLAGKVNSTSIGTTAYKLRILELSLRLFTLGMGLSLTLINIILASTGRIELMFDPGNAILSDPTVSLLAQLGATAQIMNDSSAAILTPLKINGLKNYASTCTYLFATVLGIVLVKFTDAGIHGIFGANLAAHLTYTIILTLHFKDKLPFHRFNANISEKLRSDLLKSTESLTNNSTITRSNLLKLQPITTSKKDTVSTMRVSHV